MFQQEFGILDDRLNVNGGSIAIGHPPHRRAHAH